MEGALRFVAGRPSHNVLLSRLVACYMGGILWGVCNLHRTCCILKRSCLWGIDTHPGSSFHKLDPPKLKWFEFIGMG